MKAKDGQRLRLLLVDDDADDHLILREMLDEVRSVRYEVDAVLTFEEGLECASRGGYQAYIVDYRLGLHSGLDLFRELTARGDRTPLILLTGQGDLRTDLEAMETGVADYLVKGQMTPPLLERSIRYAINRSETMQALVQMQAQVVQQDRLASIGLLASSLAHEIGTPLGVIRGRAEYLAMKEGARPLVTETTDIIVSQIDRVSQLIRSLLSLARGEEKTSIEPVNVKLVVQDVIGLLQYEFRKHGVRVIDDVPDDLSVMAVSGPLHQVFLNLLVNALHAIESVPANQRVDGHFIRIAANRIEERVHLAIEDSGCGISPTNLRRLFTPFFTTKDIGKGTGLGLATSFRILEGWGGQICVQSEVDRGSTFTLDLQTAF